MLGYIVLGLFSWFVLNVLWFGKGKVKLPPRYPGALPLVGHAPLMLGGGEHMWKLVKDLSSYSAKEDGLAYLQLGPLMIYSICDPDDYETVTSRCLEKNFFYRKFLGRWVGDGLVAASVATWKRHTKLLGPLFTQQVLSSYIGVYNQQSRALLKVCDAFAGKGQFDSRDTVRRIALEAIILTTFGLDVEDHGKLDEYVRTVDILTSIFTQRVQTFWMHLDSLYNWSELKRKEEEALFVVNGFCEKLIQRKKEAKRNGIVTEDQEGKFKGFINMMIDVLEAGEMTPQEVRDEANNIIFAGHGTIAVTMLFCLILIGSHEEVQDKIYSEIQSVFNGTNRDVEKEDLSRLPYLEAVIKEVGRLYPTAPVIFRYLDQDVKLKNYTMKSGHNCIVMLHELNRHKIWGPDKDEFRPSRWLEDSLPPNATTYTGFGAGRRACAGRSYAIMFLLTALVHFLRQYKVTADHTKLECKLEIILKPVAGHLISIERRHAV